MYGVFDDRGFLPSPDPLKRLPSQYAWIDSLGESLPDLLKQGELRNALRQIPVMDFADLTDLAQLERAMLLYSYFASAYVWGYNGRVPNKTIPIGVAKPLVNLGHILSRRPILSYASYCLSNWERAEGAEITADTVKLLQNFVDLIDEDWFILIHVDIEARGGKVLAAIRDAKQGCFLDKGKDHLEAALRVMADGITAMNKTLSRMPEKCSPEVYYNRVRPYIYGFDNVVYEGCFLDQPNSFRGETGAQSSLVPAIQSALGIRHADSVLTQHLDDMRQYMPEEHRKFLRNYDNEVAPYNDRRQPWADPAPERKDIRKRVLEFSDPNVDEVYNACVEQLRKFREQHFQYAVDYIHNKVRDPKGTGGTPFMKWLKQLHDETEQFKVKR